MNKVFDWIFVSNLIDDPWAYHLISKKCEMKDNTDLLESFYLIQDQFHDKVIKK